MAEIAAELGLSRMTVSSVINGMGAKRRISPATAGRILEYTSARGYVPRRHALQLRTGRTGAVGILHSGDLYSHLAEAYNRMCSVFSKTPGRLELMVTPVENIKEGVKELIARSVSFLVWIQASGAGGMLADRESRSYMSHAAPVIYNHHFTGRAEEKKCLMRDISW